MTGRLPRRSDGGSVETALPVVLVCNDVRGARLPFVGVDNRKAASVMTEYLIIMGHKKIAHITGAIDHVEDARERKRGFLNTMKSVGLEVPQHFVWEGNYYPASGSEAAKRYLAVSDWPTVVFAANNATALAFVRDLGLAGVSVPKDVSVVGFDDIENLAFFTPAITTMRQTGSLGCARPSSANGRRFRGTEIHKSSIRLRDRHPRQRAQLLSLSRCSAA